MRETRTYGSEGRGRKPPYPIRGCETRPTEGRAFEPRRVSGAAAPGHWRPGYGGLRNRRKQRAGCLHDVVFPELSARLLTTSLRLGLRFLVNVLAGVNGSSWSGHGLSVGTG
jgi:hypothetical protein